MIQAQTAPTSSDEGTFQGTLYEQDREHISVGMEDDPRNTLPSSPAEDLRSVLLQNNLNALRQE